MSNALRIKISILAWPTLLTLCLVATGFAYRMDCMILGFNCTYFLLAVTLLLLERWIPHEREWSESDGQLVADVLHTLVSKGSVQTLIVFSTAIGLATYITSLKGVGYGVWPRHWPLAAQVVMAIIIAEFGFYWAHRVAHEWTSLWYFHAIHHSVTKLWVMNTGRFHFIDTVKSILPGMALLLILGAPMETLTWLSAITAYVGLLTHCNVEMRFGVLSMLFNTPELHRWHHSKNLDEGNKNYGENIMLWDWVFGTWYNDQRRPPVDIGIQDAFPHRFRDQLVWPFFRLWTHKTVE